MKNEPKTKNAPFPARSEGGQKSTLLADLLNEVQAFCRERRGRVGELAAALGVVQPQLSAWLSRKFEPSGEVTLQIQAWLAREREAERIEEAERAGELAAKVAAAPDRLAAALKFLPR